MHSCNFARLETSIYTAPQSYQKGHQSDGCFVRHFAFDSHHISWVDAAQSHTE